MGLFDSPRRRARKDRREWWETAGEYPADELFYDPMLEDHPPSAFDPLGSYTGRPVDGGAPVQDADDL